MKWMKYLLGIVAIVLVGLLISATVGYRFARQQPTFYRTYQWDAAQRSVVSQRTLNKLLQTKELAAAAHFAEVRAKTQTRPSASIDAIIPRVAPLTIRFTEEELNAFIFHNIDTFNGLRKKMEEYVLDPGLFLKEGHLIIAGQIKGTDYLASVHFAPSIDEAGQLRLRIVKTMAGRLPVPRALLADKLKQLHDTIASRLPDLQRAATMDASGGSNPPLVMAAITKLLLAALSDAPAAPVLFMPVDEKGKAMPLRVTHVSAADDSLSLTFEPMSPEQRSEVFEQIRKP